MTNFLRFCKVSSFLLASMIVLQGQDFQNIAPKPVTPPAAPKEAAPAPKSVGESQIQEEQLVPKLKGLVFVPQPEAVIKNGVAAQGVVLKKLTVPDVARFKKMGETYLGQPFSHSQLNMLIQKVIVFYRNHDRPVVDVIVPEQDITNGVIQLIVLEGRVGKIVVTGNRWFPSQEIIGNIRAQPGGPIRSSQLQNDLDWVNSNPFHSSDLVYRPGEQLGQTDLVLKTADRFPARFYVGYEDSGNQATGYDRYEAGLNWGDAFNLGLGQQLNYQYTTSANFYQLRAQSGSYVIPLPWRHTLNFFGSYVDSKGGIPPFIGLQGRSYQISGRYAIPLPSFRTQDVNVRENFSLGCDYKYNNNSLEFGGEEVGTTLYDVDQFVFNYSLNETDSYGFFTLGETFNYSPGGFGGHNVDAYYNATHTGAQSNYIYNTLVLERDTRLPDDFTLVLRGTVQHSSGNLVPSEQLGFGGYDSVRGYDEREVNSDEGFIFTTEVRTPSISFGNWADAKKIWNDQMQFLAFWDYGSASNHYTLENETKADLSSAGVGFRYNVGTHVSVRFDYGFQLLTTNLDPQHGSRANIGVTVSY